MGQNVKTVCLLSTNYLTGVPNNKLILRLYAFKNDDTDIKKALFLLDIGKLETTVYEIVLFTKELLEHTVVQQF